MSECAFCVYEVKKDRTMSFSTFVLVGLLAFSQAGGAWSRVHTRVVSGTSAKPGDYPFQVDIEWKGIQNCGGSIINENYILTAAHCSVGLEAKDLEVLAGTVDTENLTEGSTKHNVSKILVHEKYEADNSWKNDIAVMKVVPPFTFSKNIAPAKLPEADEDYEEGFAVKVSGFGRITTNSPSSTKLLQTDLTIITREDCQSAYDFINNTIRETNICAGNSQRVTGSCKGDSGGPLSVKGKVVGLVSFAGYGGCANEKKMPSVLTRISKYIDWISENTKN